MRPGCHVRACQGRLLAGHAASYGVEVETGILRCFNGCAQVLTQEGRNLNPSLLYVENYGPGQGQFLRRRISELRPGGTCGRF